MREIYLFGPLAEAFGEKFVLDVRDAFEAARALAEMIPGFQEMFVGPDGRQAYYVYLGDQQIGEKECALSSDKSISFVPAVAGAAFGDIFQIVLGAALIVGSFFVAPINPMLAAGMFQAGVAFTLNGVAGLLTPTPKADKPTDQQTNTTFDGGQNLSAAGNPFPVLLGEGYCGSMVASASIRTEQLL